MTVTSSTRELDETRGVVRVEDLYDTDIADLWDACTRPERLARWIARVDGDDLRQGGTVQAVFTSSGAGPSTSSRARPRGTCACSPTPAPTRRPSSRRG